MKINELTKEAHETALEKGWWDEERSTTECLALVTCEISEAIEELRKGNYKKFNEELADVYIRLGDLCGHLGIDIEKEIIKKMEFNKTRPYKHGKNF